MFLPSCVGKGGKPERPFSEEFLCGALDKQHIIAARKGGEGIAPQPIWGKSQYGPGNTRLGEGGKHLADGQLLRRENFPQKEGAPLVFRHRQYVQVWQEVEAVPVWAQQVEEA